MTRAHPDYRVRTHQEGCAWVFAPFWEEDDVHMLRNPFVGYHLSPCGYCIETCPSPTGRVAKATFPLVHVCLRKWNSRGGASAACGFPRAARPHLSPEISTSALPILAIADFPIT